MTGHRAALVLVAVLLLPALAAAAPEGKIVIPTTWEFKIRKGVKFHNGEDVDADAVKFSLDRIRDPELKARQAVYFKLVTSVDVVDKYTVRVVTAKPHPTLENHHAL